MLVVTWPMLQAGLMQKGIQHAAIQRVTCFIGWTKGWGRLAISSKHLLNRGWSCSCQTLALEGMVLDMVAQNPRHSTWEIDWEFSVQHDVIYLILQDEDLYSYYCPRVQVLSASLLSSQYCEWLLWEHEHDTGFLECILWSDEEAFTCEGVFNSHNSHLRAQHNPCGSGSIKFARALMYGPVLLAVVWLGHTYYWAAWVALRIVCFSRKCWCCIEDVPLVVWHDMQFQHVGVLVHFGA
jgi:hypothetical protein